MEESQKKQTILVVDDDPVQVRLIKKIMETEGYVVLAAEEAPIGLELAMKQHPDLVILDVMMPIINGYNICRMMKSEEEHKHIPIILLTSRAEEDDKKIGEEVGADAYIPKPFETQNLVCVVRELLEGKSSC